MEQREHYSELVGVVRDDSIKDKFIIFENDPIKGRRIIHYDLPSDSIYREEKF